MKWDKTVDLLVVGSGNGAMTAAICSYDMGVNDVLIIEKGKQFGGTSSMSGGGVWVPCNRYAKALGIQDSFEEAKQYLTATIPADKVSEKMIDTYLTNAPKVIDYLHENTQVKYQSLASYPDYYTDQPGAKEGHRSIEPVPIRGDVMGKDHKYLLPGCINIADRYAITQEEGQTFVCEKKGWQLLALRLLFTYYFDFAWVFTHKQSRRTTCGAAGIIRFWLSLQDRNIPMWLETEFKELVMEEGKVVGAVIEKEGGTLRVKTNKGVILASGGFERNQQMREQYLPKPTNAEWSAGCRTNTGDGIRAGIDVNAKIHLMENAWWCTNLGIPGKEWPFISIVSQSLPGAIIVNKKGKRFENESQNYMQFQMELYKKHAEEEPCIPMYMIFDHNFKNNYQVYPLLGPNFMIPKSYEEEGFVVYADTIEELAVKVGIDADGLTETVERFNTFVSSGVDEDFHRGEVAYDRYYGDPDVKPNPCLGPILKPPFYAMHIQAGDIGTQGGLLTNENGQVVDNNDLPIEGLYACGNCSAAVLPTYPGPGSTLGPAMTFAYQAAKHITGWVES